MDKIWMWIAWRLPRRLVMWTAVRLMAHATQGAWAAEEVPGVTITDALKRWGTAEQMRE